MPMAELRKQMEQIGCTEVRTLLNSGNVIFNHQPAQEHLLEKQLAEHLGESFGFPIPVLIRTAEEIHALVDRQIFKDVEITKDTRLYISFVRDVPHRQITLPWLSEDGSFRIVAIVEKNIGSILDLAVSPTLKGMDALEQLFGKDMTTRNWNTVLNIKSKLNS